MTMPPKHLVHGSAPTRNKRCSHFQSRQDTSILAWYVLSKESYMNRVIKDVFPTEPHRSGAAHSEVADSQRDKQSSDWKHTLIQLKCASAAPQKMPTHTFFHVWMMRRIAPPPDIQDTCTSAHTLRMYTSSM